MQKRTVYFVFCALLLSSIAATIIFGWSFTVKIFYLANLFILLFIVALYKRIRWLSISMTLLFLLFLASFIGIEFAIMKEMKPTEKFHRHEVPVSIVLGAGLKGDQLSHTLRRRLDQGLEYFNYNKQSLIILSGGQGKDELISEAEAMHAYLTTHGVSPERLILEDKSTTTQENLSFSKRIIEERLGMKGLTVLIVTSDYHMFRAKKIAESLNIQAIGLPSETPLFIRLNYMLREYFAVVKMLFDRLYPTYSLVSPK